MSEDGFGKLGFYSLAVVFLTSGICSFFATSFISKLGTRVSLGLGAIFNSLWVYSAILAAYKNDNPYTDSIITNDAFVTTVILILAVVSGLGNSLLWVASGYYTAECANFQNKGCYFSLFWILLKSSSIFGNLIGAFVLGRMN